MPAIGQPVQGYYYDEATDTLRPIAAQASTVDLPGRHRYATTAPPDLVDGQLWLDSDAPYTPSSQVPIFADAATRDAQWPSPTNGSLCVTLDTYRTWLRKNGVWQPPPGTIVAAGGGRHADQQPNSGSYWDLAYVQLAAVPYPTRVQAQVTFWWGFSTFPGTAAQDFYMYSSSSSIGSPGDTVVPANTWGNQTMLNDWAVAANADPSFKGRLIPKNFGGGTSFWATAYSLWTQRAA